MGSYSAQPSSLTGSPPITNLVNILFVTAIHRFLFCWQLCLIGQQSRKAAGEEEAVDATEDGADADVDLDKDKEQEPRPLKSTARWRRNESCFARYSTVCSQTALSKRIGSVFKSAVSRATHRKVKLFVSASTRETKKFF